jgi:lipopolysaccharide/colanic/teichoic acid biosynthesis glycosyltransferase
MQKRIFDIVFSIIGLFFIGLFLFLFWILTSIDTKSNGFFVQNRVGQFGKLFKIYKLKTVNDTSESISKFGNFLRKSKIDELPQLWNILIGNMSFVGPRPDIQGYYDRLEGENRKILELKPGLTSDASIKYSNEEEILIQEENPLQYNDEIIFPEKVKMNLEYYYSQSIVLDLQIIFKTLFR